MPSASGSAIDELKVSSDATAGNYEELRTDVVATVTYNDGNVLEDRTRGGDAVHRYDPVKKNPFCRFDFDVNTDPTAAWGILGLNPGGDKAWTMKIGEARHTGIMIIEGPEETYNSETGVYNMSVTFRPRGSAWVNTRDTG